MQEGEPVESFPNLEGRQRTFPAHGINVHQTKPRGVGRQLGFYRKALPRRGFPHERDMPLAGLLGPEQVHQRDQHRLALRQ